MKTTMVFNESITSMRGCFVIHFNYKGDEPIRRPIEVEEVTEFNGRLRYSVKNTAGEYRIDLDRIDRIEILKYEPVRISF